MNYKGNKCISCGEIFTDKSDVVVCPDCGTPYHRECYKKEGKCINEKLHEEKKSWKSEIKVNEKHEVICKKCGTENKDSSRYCENCGESLNKPEKITLEKIDKDENYAEYIKRLTEDMPKTICEELDIKDEKIDDVSLLEMSYFVKSNIPYYMSVFKKFQSQNKKTSFNFLCFLVPYYFFANRKMYLWGLISFIIMTTLSIPSMIYLLAENNFLLDITFITTSGFNAIMNTFKFLQIAFQVIIAISANWIYCKHIVKSIKEIKSTYPEKQHINMISQKGGTSFPALLITLGIEMVTSVALCVLLIFILTATNIF